MLACSWNAGFGVVGGLPPSNAQRRRGLGGSEKRWQFSFKQVEQMIHVFLRAVVTHQTNSPDLTSQRPESSSHLNAVVIEQVAAEGFAINPIRNPDGRQRRQA